jgi:flagellar protein FlaG
MNIAPVETDSTIQVVSVAAAAPKRNVIVQTEAGGEATASDEQVKRMTQEIESQIQRMNVSLEFSRYGERGEKIAVVLANKATGEVIREIPPKEIQNLYNSINDLAGMIFDRQA